MTLAAHLQFVRLHLRDLTNAARVRIAGNPHQERESVPPLWRLRRIAETLAQFKKASDAGEAPAAAKAYFACADRFDDARANQPNVLPKRRRFL